MSLPHTASWSKSSQLSEFREIIADHYENHKEYRNTLSGEKVQHVLKSVRFNYAVNF
jgi:hypothetical protein